MFSSIYLIFYDDFNFFVYNKSYINVVLLFVNSNMIDRFIITFFICVDKKMYKCTCSLV